MVHQFNVHSVRRSNNVHEQAGVIWQWQQEYAQISRGFFQGMGAHLSTREADFYFEQMNKATYQRGYVPENSIGLAIVLACDGPMATCGRVVSQGDVVLMSGKSGYEFKSAENMRVIVANIHRETEFVRYLSNEIGLNLRTEPGAIGRIATPQLLKLESAFHLADNAPGLSSLLSPNFMDTLADTLFDSLTLAKPVPRQTPTKVHHHWGLIDKAYALIRNNPYAARSISELVDALHVSRGTFQNATRNTLGMKAAEFLRAVRLNQVLREVLMGDSITRSATTWGFLHLSHFAREYRKLFGELPSETLKTVQLKQHA